MSPSRIHSTILSLGLLVGLLYAPAAHAAINIVDDYLTPHYNNSVYTGSSGSGSSYDLSSGWSSEVPGDKIVSITIFKGSNYIKGIRLNFLYGDSAAVGSTGGDGHTKYLAANEYVEKVRFYEKNEGSISRIRLWTNLGNELYWGSNNGWNLWNEQSFSFGRALIGFWGTASSGKIWSISAVNAVPLLLDFQGIEFDANVTVGNADQAFLSSSVAANGTSVSQSMGLGLSYTEGESASDTWSNTLGASTTMGISVSASAKAAGFAEVSAEWSYSVTASMSETVGETTTTDSSTTTSTTLNLTVPAMTIYAVKATVYQSSATFPYTATYVNTWDNKVFNFTGQLDHATSVSTFTQWLEIGYVDGAGHNVIYPQYQGEWGQYETIRGTDTKLTTDALAIPLDDPNWVMSAEEQAFRKSHGFEG